jgi:predicted hydrocarbon binding protein
VQDFCAIGFYDIESFFKAVTDKAASSKLDPKRGDDDEDKYEIAEGGGNFLLGTHIWTMTRNEFRKIIGPVASDVILFNLWRVYGRATARELLKRMHSFQRHEQRSLRDALFEFVDINGWDQKSVEIKEAEGETSLSLFRCPFCEPSTSDKPVCFEMLGMIAGFADLVMGSETEVVELKCMAAREKSCTFVMRYNVNDTDSLSES